MENRIKKMAVLYNGKKVGYLQSLNNQTYFAYDESWIQNGFSISPRSLPLENRVFASDPMRFGGLLGVFADSLPDSWGSLVTMKYLRKKGISYLNLNPLEKLSLVGKDGFGGFSYFPSEGKDIDKWKGTMDDFFRESMKTMEEDEDENLDEIFTHESSVGGARPKAHIRFENEEWIVKFRGKNDPSWMGRMEYEYNLAAKECGIEVPESRLFESQTSDGYFASKRFDRKEGKRVHVLSLSALLEIPHDLPLLDYVSFLQATLFITQSQKEVEKAFRLACFNVFSKNYDDHSKNFAFLYDLEKGGYVLSPAYDLTRTIHQKEHEMTCVGKALPNEDDLFLLAKKMNIPSLKAKNILFLVKNVVESRLKEWIQK